MLLLLFCGSCLSLFHCCFNFVVVIAGMGSYLNVPAGGDFTSSMCGSVSSLYKQMNIPHHYCCINI